MTSPTAESRGPLATVVDILGMIKFSHTLFALPFALLGGILAVRDPRITAHAGPSEWLGILLCMVTARSAAMAFNRLADRLIDARNPRTATRHIPAGRLSARSVAAFTLANSILFIASTLLFLPSNPWPLRLSVPVLAWLLGYSYAKRFTSLAHYWLGLGLAFAPVAAWIALTGRVDPTPLWLGLAVFFWVGGFDILYACQDHDFDRQAGLRSLPVRLGVRNALRLAAASHAVTVAALIALGLSYPPFGWIYYTGVAVVACVLVYEHALVRPDDLSRVNLAFFHLNAAISLGLLVVGSADAFF
jgi:4-hydroxybenzoate polyprenyltransferase